MKSLVSRFVKDESGATAIEYGLIAAGISVAIITVVQGLGTKLFNNIDFVENKLQNPTKGFRFEQKGLRQRPEPFLFVPPSIAADLIWPANGSATAPS